MELFREIKLSLAECLFCLACQQPLSKGDTLRLIAHLREDNSLTGDDKLEPVTLCLLLTLLYCFDVRILEQEDAAGTAHMMLYLLQLGIVYLHVGVSLCDVDVQQLYISVL